MERAAPGVRSSPDSVDGLTMPRGRPVVISIRTRTDVAEVGMPPGRVVEAVDVVADRRVGDVAVGVVFVVDALGLQRREEALGDGVVVAVAGTAPRTDDPPARSSRARTRSTWTLGRPSTAPRLRAAARPQRVRSRIHSRSVSPKRATSVRNARPIGEVVSRFSWHDTSATFLTRNSSTKLSKSLVLRPRRSILHTATTSTCPRPTARSISASWGLFALTPDQPWSMYVSWMSQPRSCASARRASTWRSTR
jgi:hypothetical protein